MKKLVVGSLLCVFSFSLCMDSTSLKARAEDDLKELQKKKEKLESGIRFTELLMETNNDFDQKLLQDLLPRFNKWLGWNDQDLAELEKNFNLLSLSAYQLMFDDEEIEKWNEREREEAFEKFKKMNSSKIKSVIEGLKIQYNKFDADLQNLQQELSNVKEEIAEKERVLVLLEKLIKTQQESQKVDQSSQKFPSQTGSSNPSSKESSLPSFSLEMPKLSDANQKRLLAGLKRTGTVAAVAAGTAAIGYGVLTARRKALIRRALAAKGVALEDLTPEQIDFLAAAVNAGWTPRSRYLPKSLDFRKKFLEYFVRAGNDPSIRDFPHSKEIIGALLGMSPEQFIAQIKRTHPDMLQQAIGALGSQKESSASERLQARPLPSGQRRKGDPIQPARDEPIVSF